VEAAWAYRHRREIVGEEIKEVAGKAQHRLHGRYRKLMAQGKNKAELVTVVGQELLGFIWAIGVKVKAANKESQQPAA